MARSPYLEAQVNRWCKEKKELVIEDCDLVTFNVIVDYIYGIAIPDSVRINATANTEEDSVPTAKKRKLDLKKKYKSLVKLLKLNLLAVSLFVLHAGELVAVAKLEGACQRQATDVGSCSPCERRLEDVGLLW